MLCLVLAAGILVSCASPARRQRLARGKPRATIHQAKGGVCRSLAADDRAAILEVADPTNYPSTRYRKGPDLRLPPEVETDCSHFVHEVYRRAGLPYAFRPTDSILDAPEFEAVNDQDAEAGDLLVMRGHMGILDEQGKLISATLTRHRRAPSSITRYDLRNFRKIRGKRTVLRYRCRPNLKTTSR